MAEHPEFDVGHEAGQQDARDARQEALATLAALVDPDPCRYDHNGLCQAHGLDPAPCPHARAKLLLSEGGHA